MNNEVGIYIHIPFCSSKCFYCDFYSETFSKGDIVKRYIDAVCREILQNTDILSTRKITSIYIGGGTPSVIESKYIQQILDVLHMFGCKSLEITIEVNPESATYEKLVAYKEMGINRLSIGVQSVNECTLKNIGRSSSLNEINRVIGNAISVDFKNISTDIIIGLPNETLKDFLNTVEYILKFKENITHISAYSLEVHEGTKLHFLLNNEFISLPKENTERKMKYELDRLMDENGYNRYEISNYAKARI